MEKSIQHVTFYGSPYEFYLLSEGMATLPHIKLEHIDTQPLGIESDLLVIGHSLPEFDEYEITKNRKKGVGPKSIASISHGPYPQNGSPSPINIDVDSFHFQWVSDASLSGWIVKLVEDHLFANFYYENQHRRFLLLLEDEINFASYFIPIIIKELEERTLSLMPEKSNLSEKDSKKETERPILLLASNYEQAIEYLDKFGDRMVGVISSLGFPKNGKNNLNAGFKLIDKVKALPNEIPIIIQTSQKDKKIKIRERGGAYMNKHSSKLLKQLRTNLLEYFGFGDFIFRMPDKNNTVVAKATNIKELKECLSWVPLKSFIYHASKRHFSNWLGVHGHLELAEIIRPLSISLKNGDVARKELSNLLENITL
jgi:hypothetical protein